MKYLSINYFVKYMSVTPNANGRNHRKLKR